MDNGLNHDQKVVDILVIGGGINGAGIARDAAGRGLDVVLCEKDDLAQHTSSASTKLIHGGLRYLETYDFHLVRHALREREILLHSAPHIIWPLRFILPHHRALRPRWLIRLGLFLYDHIGGRRLLPASVGVNLAEHPAGAALKPEFRRGFEYSDCWVQDARLVVINARDASQRGARILTRTECIKLQRDGSLWNVTLRDNRNSSIFEMRTRCIVNASGPWVEKTLGLLQSNESDVGVRLIKGSHILVPRLFEHAYPYIFQNSDQRVIFAIPYENNYTLLGTTDVDYSGDPDKVSIDQSEIDYICGAVNHYFKQPVKPEHIVWSYAGVRPLFDDHSNNASKVTRDYVLKLDAEGAPILSVFGGKITTYRKLAEQVVDLLKRSLGFSTDAWTETGRLPGGDIPVTGYEKFLDLCADTYDWLDNDILADYVRNYGSDITLLLQGCTDMKQLGRHFGAGLYACEIDFLMKYEWAQTAEDILWRRSKKGLRFSADETNKLQRWMETRDDVQQVPEPDTAFQSNSINR